MQNFSCFIVSYISCVFLSCVVFLIFFYIPCLFCLGPLSLAPDNLSLLYLFYLQCFFYFLVELLDSSIPSSFQLDPLQCFSLFIGFHSQVLDCLHHFHQPNACIFLGIYFFLKLFLFLELFLCVFFKLLETFDEVYDDSFKLCILCSIKVISIDKYFYRNGVFWEDIDLIFYIVGNFLMRSGYGDFHCFKSDMDGAG